MPVTFTPPVAPSPGTAIETDLALRKASFGDGYGQASPMGLNHVRRRVALRWDALTLEQAQEIDAFFVQQGGYLPFAWTVRGEETPRRWTCEKWTISDGAPATARAELVENFSL